MKKMVAIIPARYASSRFPAKLLQQLEGISIIQRTYTAVKQSGIFDDVIVACDHDDIAHEIKKIDGHVFRSLLEHESGSDRIAEVAGTIDADFIVNVQGDEPFISVQALEKVKTLLQKKEVEVASLMTPIVDEEEFYNPNCVKVVCDMKGRALYFSRSAIPHSRDANKFSLAYRHIGIYGFTKDALLKFTSFPTSTLEEIEKLENLRMLENGMSVYLDIIDNPGISIDTEEDFRKAQEYIRSSLH